MFWSVLAEDSPLPWYLPLEHISLEGSNYWSVYPSSVTKIDIILVAAKSRGIQLNTVAYNSGIGSYLSMGDYKKALVLYTSMRAGNVKPDAVTYNILISGSCKLGRYVESLKFFEDMLDMNIHLTKEVYSSVICSYVKQASVAGLSLWFTVKN